MILLTANRSMKGENSLEKVIRKENTSESLPVVTIGSVDRLDGTGFLMNDGIKTTICQEFMD